MENKRTIQEVTDTFLFLLNNVLENADENLIFKTEGWSKKELKERGEKVYNLFLKKPEQRLSNLNNVMNRYETYLK